ncbi:MAG: GHMP kinase [Candidatus Omnitrophica bacterium]|nr:GHMP kinase [Candidatus Omnitrophota bacterium]MDD5353336.1 GHMP kinase [Candidatus Omnitrophota bacterium]MDD5591874.1 GHMP kinase [Candidatus Omnitrophota bacterium]
MIISRTPLRMSFVGGGSDFKEYYQQNSGAVVSTAINKYIYITVNKKFDDGIRVGYSKIEYVDNIDKIEHNLVREALRLVGITKGIDIVYMSDMLPAHEGSGLGASSSLTVGTLNALHAYKGEHVSAETLAREACEIEIDVLGHPIGKQDQYAAAYGGFNHIQFNTDQSVFIDPIIFKNETKVELNKNLLLFYTAINSRSDSVLTEQKRNIKNNSHILREMVGLSKELRAALESNRLSEFGNILNKGWGLKKKLASNITNPLINSYYEEAIDAGAEGGKILGSGGGGFLLFYCEEDKQDNVRKALSNLKEVSFAFEPQGSKIIYVND